MQKIFEVDDIDLFMMKSIDDFDKYMHDVLCVDTNELSDLQKDNVTFVFVGKNDKKILNVFPWNLILADRKERMNLCQKLYELYGALYKDVCYADVEVSVAADVLKSWSDDVALNQVPEFLKVFEEENYYPVVLTLHCPDAGHSRCHLHICCIKD